MPTYEYGCAACGFEWEETQRITEAPKEVCPKCLEPKAHRLISGGTNFILKGGGWYSDLYSSQKPAKKDGEGTAKGSSGDATSTTAAKSESTSTASTETKAVSSPAPGPSAPPATS